MLYHVEALWDFLVGGSRLSARRADCCEAPISVAEVIEVTGRWDLNVYLEIYKKYARLVGALTGRRRRQQAT